MEAAVLLAVLAYLATHAPTVFGWNSTPWIAAVVVTSWRLVKVWGYAQT